MVVFVFKIIFLVVMVIGGLVMLAAPMMVSQVKNKDIILRNRKITKVRLIGVIIACVGLLMVIILSNF